jgi:hypothetical protein
VAGRLASRYVLGKMKIQIAFALFLSFASCMPTWWQVKEETRVEIPPESQCVINALNGIDGVQVVNFQDRHNYFFMSNMGRGEMHVERIDNKLFVTSNFNGKGRKTPQKIQDDGPAFLQKINEIVVRSCVAQK